MIEVRGIEANLIMSFKYDGDGHRVDSFQENGGSDIITVYIGNYAEWNDTTSAFTRYYNAGDIRIAVRAAYLRYQLADHLGSTTIVVSGVGAYNGKLGCTAWGRIRPSSGEGLLASASRAKKLFAISGSRKTIDKECDPYPIKKRGKFRVKFALPS